MDSILIDEARTPLIISGPVEDSSNSYKAVDVLIPKLGADDFELDEKARAVTLTDDGVEHAEALLAEAGLIEEGTSFTTSPASPFCITSIRRCAPTSCSSATAITS